MRVDEVECGVEADVLAVLFVSLAEVTDVDNNGDGDVTTRALDRAELLSTTRGWMCCTEMPVLLQFFVCVVIVYAVTFCGSALIIFCKGTEVGNWLIRPQTRLTASSSPYIT